MEAAAKSPALSLRDTAMFSIAASLGMRAGDIVRLTLSDIDWVHHEVRFVQGKTGVELCLPLEASVETPLRITFCTSAQKQSLKFFLYGPVYLLMP